MSHFYCRENAGDLLRFAAAFVLCASLALNFGIPAAVKI